MPTSDDVSLSRTLILRACLERDPDADPEIGSREAVTFGVFAPDGGTTVDGRLARAARELIAEGLIQATISEDDAIISDIRLTAAGVVQARQVLARTPAE